MTQPSKTKQIKQLKETISQLRSVLSVIKNQNDCIRHGHPNKCVGLENLTLEERKFQSRLAEVLCPHCLAQLAMGGKI